MAQAVLKPHDAAALSAGETILRATNVRRTFKMGDDSVQVLNGVDLSVRRGEFVAIEGRSGSGKSTLLHILAGLDAADGGAVAFEGHDITALAAAGQRWLRFARNNWIGFLFMVLNRADQRLAEVRNRHFGFVFQFYHLLPELNVLENTLLGPMIELSWFGFRAKKKDLRERATAVLDQLGMAHRLKHRPSQLSGGERQRVAIARALMNQPKVLFADEPTGNLDAETGKQIMGVLEKLHREEGQTIVMVTHDRTIARRADRVLVLRDGKLMKAEDSGQ